MYSQKELGKSDVDLSINSTVLAFSAATELQTTGAGSHLTINFGASDVKLNSSQIQVNGPLNCENTVTLKSSTATLTHAASADAEDLTISQTGAHDSSLVLESGGTDRQDAVKIKATAGGIQFDAFTFMELLPGRYSSSHEVEINVSDGTQDCIIGRVNDYPLRKFSIITSVTVIVTQLSNEANESFNLIMYSNNLNEKLLHAGDAGFSSYSIFGATQLRWVQDGKFHAVQDIISKRDGEGRQGTINSTNSEGQFHFYL